MRELHQRLYDGQEQLDPASIASAMGTYLSDAAPASEATAPVAGTASKATRQDHQHPRKTSTTLATVVTGSTVTVAFTYITADGTLGFINKPGMVMTEIEGDTSATSQPATFKVQSWVVDGVTGRYTGAVIKVWRAQTVPQNLATLLLSAVYNLFGATVVGTVLSVVAVARSDV